jgi:HlyD family secretion protein
MSKKTIYILIGGAVVIIAGLIILSKSDCYRIKIKPKLKLRQSNNDCKTVSATGKIQPEIEVKFHLRFRERLFFECKEGQVVKRRFTSR